VQHASDKEHYFNGVLTKQPAVDLLIVDIPKGLPVPTVSIPPSSIPQWNAFSKKGLQDVFNFGENYLHDDGTLLILYPFTRHILSYILGFCEDFGFKLQKKWVSVNRLHLMSALDLNETVRTLTI